MVFTAFNKFYKALTEKEKKQIIDQATIAFAQFLDSLKIEWKNDLESIDTPKRVATMYVNDILTGRFTEKPITKKKDLQQNNSLTLKVYGPISIKSLCIHHCMPFMGFIIIGIYGIEILGVSKYTEICNWYCHRGQMQENLGNDILQELTSIHPNSEISVFISAQHTCTSYSATRNYSSNLYTVHSTKNFNQYHDNFFSTCIQMIQNS